MKVRCIDYDAQQIGSASVSGRTEPWLTYLDSEISQQGLLYRQAAIRSVMQVYLQALRAWVLVSWIQIATILFSLHLFLFHLLLPHLLPTILPL